MDWSEVRARLVREEERLRYKAANLQARGKTVMAAQELVVADDIRAALEEIERLRVERDGAVNGLALMEERAEAAEAKLAEVQEAGATIVKAAERFRQEGSADRAEVERLERDRAEVIAALGPLAHPGLSPAANVTELRKRAEAAAEHRQLYVDRCRELDAAREETKAAEAEVKRLEGLILAWWDGPDGKYETAGALCVEGCRIHSALRGGGK